MFLDIDKQQLDRAAVIDDSGNTLTYADVCDVVKEMDALLIPRCLVFCMCENSAGSLVGYIAFESNRQVPLLLSANLDAALRSKLDSTYSPGYYWMPERKAGEIKGTAVYRKYGYALIRTENDFYPLNDQLSLLITTSGSTGSPKLVRHKYGNLEANAANVAKAFAWSDQEISICDLPMNYTMGLNVINSHLVVGATVLMIKKNLMDPDFWTFIKDQKGTNFCGVPFSYEVLRRIGFDKMDLPDLFTLSEGGGKLTDRMFKWVVDCSQMTGRRFCATFGTSETSARMSFLDPAMAAEKTGSIGKAIPEGELFLVDETHNADGTVSGELCYRGPNVTMGYAMKKDDLLKGDEFCGEYHTGDIACRDQDGFYYVVGRKGRFLKLFGLRVSLDETEKLLKEEYPSTEFVCAGDDKKMIIYATDPLIEKTIIPFVSQKTNLHSSAFQVRIVESIPRNEYGKVQLEKLNQMSC